MFRSLVKSQQLKVKSLQKGFTLLFAVLVGSLLFSIGIAIAHVAVREIILSATAKGSEGAFYAADGGAECALYWDLEMAGTFPMTSASPRPRNTIVCGGVSVPLTFVSSNAVAATTTFSAPFYSSCTEVLVAKGAPQGGSREYTVIESRGRNICGTNENPARVERALRVRY
ncbi:MAG: hypothetical protein Q7R88_00800 [bacterium]|nr:hypothetical protein [bacterium]